MPHDVHGDFAPAWHPDAVAIDIEHRPIEQPFV
jgi:hypothetical protein